MDWVANDQIVLTTTDYLPGHSEQFTIQSVSTSGGVSTITVTSPVQYPHNGTTYNLGAAGVPDDIGPDQDPNVICTSGQTRCVETRAAVGLLTRSIRIVSGRRHLEHALSRIDAPGTLSAVSTAGAAGLPGLPGAGRRDLSDWARAAASCTIPSTSTWRGRRRNLPGLAILRSPSWQGLLSAGLDDSLVHHLTPLKGSL